MQWPPSIEPTRRAGTVEGACSAIDPPARRELQRGRCRAARPPGISVDPGGLSSLASAHRRKRARAIHHPLRSTSEPRLPHRFAHQRADRRRIATPSYAHQAYLSPKFGLDDRQTDHAEMFDRVCRHECKSQPGGDHSQSPVVALAPIDGVAGDSVLFENPVGVTSEFAIHAMDIALAIHLLDGESPRFGETMVAVNGENHLLAKQGNRVNALIGLLAWQGVDGDLEIASQKLRAQIFGIRIAKFQ